MATLGEVATSVTLPPQSGARLTDSTQTCFLHFLSSSKNSKPPAVFRAEVVLAAPMASYV